MKTFITVDGPSGVGKGTVSSMVAAHFGIPHVDTGAVYRATALVAKERGLLDDLSALNVSEIADIVPNLDIQFLPGKKIVLGMVDRTDDIRSPETTNLTPHVAKLPEVRSGVNNYLSKVARATGAVIDGRVGAFEFPEAKKFFLTASDEVTADRRFKEYRAAGKHVSYQQILSDIKERNRQDMERSHSPLRPHEEAVIVDTSAITARQVADQIIASCEQAMGASV